LSALWIREGRIKFTKELNEVITYHDSCYLGRYNTVYNPPREILKAISGVKVMEANRNRENAMCCGRRKLWELESILREQSSFLIQNQP
jgi:Fe-S oxidoreductase